jgi:hypothetical protein
MSEDRFALAASAPVPDLRPRRLLRRLAKPPRHEALSPNRPSDYEGYDPPEGWGWCYIDEAMLDLSDRATPHNGPIPRYY